MRTVTLTVEKKVEETKEEIKTPLFYVDVDFGVEPGEKTDRIEIFREGNTTMIVRDFCEKHGIQEK